MTTAIQQPVNDALTIGEKRALTLDAARVDERHLVDGPGGPGDQKQLPMIEAELVSTRRNRKERRYHVAFLDLNIKPFADCTDDIAEITRVVQAHLAPRLRN